MTLEELIVQEATKRGLDPRVALSLISHESGADTNAVGDGGQSVGLGQLKVGAARDAGVDPYQRTDPFVGAAGSTEYLRQQLVRSGGDYNKALSFYNQGPGNMNAPGIAYGNRVIRTANSLHVKPGSMSIDDALNELGAATPDVGPPPRELTQPGGPQGGGISLDGALKELGSTGADMTGTIPIDPNAHATPESPIGDTRLQRDLAGMAQMAGGSGVPSMLSALARAVPLAYGVEKDIGHWSTRQPRDASGRFAPRKAPEEAAPPVEETTPATHSRSAIPWWAPWGASLMGHPYVGLGLRAARQLQMRRPPLGS